MQYSFFFLTNHAIFLKVTILFKKMIFFLKKKLEQSGSKGYFF